MQLQEILSELLAINYPNDDQQPQKQREQELKKLSHLKQQKEKLEKDSKPHDKISLKINKLEEKLKKIDESEKIQENQKIQLLERLKTAADEQKRSFRTSNSVDYSKVLKEVETLLAPPTSESKAAPSPPTPTHSLFNQSVYQALYPYLRIVHAFENNGEPEQLAYHLSCVFTTTQEALKYIQKAIEQSKEGAAHPVHDACLFSLPPSTSSYKKHWQTLSTEGQCSNLFKQEFLDALSVASDIESQYKKDQQEKDHLLGEVYRNHFKTELEKKENNKKYDEQIKELKNKIEKEIEETKKKCESYATGFENGVRLERTPEDDKKYAKNLEELDKLYCDRSIVQLHLVNNFKKYNISNIIDLYKRMISKSEKWSIYAFLARSGINDTNRRSLYDIRKNPKNQEAGKNIPEVPEIKLPDGFYIKKLNMKIEADAALAACLGKKTDCCQSLGGLGEDCVEHGLTHPDSGFYVLFKKSDSKDESKKELPDVLRDEVWGQTWVNRTTPSGGLVFDSIESEQAKKNKKNGDQVISAFRALASNLVLENKDVPFVNCGARSGISQDVGFRGMDCKAENPIGYDLKKHRDSEKQLFLADQRFLFEYNVSDSKTSPKWIFRKYYFEKISKDENEKQKTIDFSAFFCFYGNIEFKKIILNFMKENTLSDQEKSNMNVLIHKMCQTLLDYRDSEENNVLMISILKKIRIKSDLLFYIFDQEITKFLDQKNKNGETALMIVLSDKLLHFDILRNQIIDLSLKNGANLSLKNNNGETALMIATRYSYRKYPDMTFCGVFNQGFEVDHTDVILKILESKSKSEFINLTNNHGQTALMIAIEFCNYKAAKILLENGADPSPQDEQGNTALILAVKRNKIDIFDKILESKSKSKFINLTNNNGKTALMIAVEQNNSNLAKKLLQNGADPLIIDDQNQTALSLSDPRGLLKGIIKSYIQALSEKKESNNNPDFASVTSEIPAPSLTEPTKEEEPLLLRQEQTKKSPVHPTTFFADTEIQRLSLTEQKEVKSPKDTGENQQNSELSHSSPHSLPNTTLVDRHFSDSDLQEPLLPRQAETVDQDKLLAISQRILLCGMIIAGGISAVGYGFGISGITNMPGMISPLCTTDSIAILLTAIYIGITAIRTIRSCCIEEPQDATRRWFF